MKANLKNILVLVFIVGAVILAVSLFSNVGGEEEPFRYSDLVELFDKDMVVSIVIDEEGIATIKAHDFVIKDGKITPTDEVDSEGKKKLITLNYQFSYNIQIEQINDLIREKMESGNPTNLEEYDYLPAEETPWYVLYLPYIITAVVIIVLWIFLMRQASGGAGGKIGSFSKSKAKVVSNDKNPVKFADVAGADEERRSSRRSLKSSRIPRSSLSSAREFLVAFSLWALPVRVRLFLQRLLQARQACPSSPSPALTLWKCSWAWALPACATSLPRARRTPPASSLSTKSTPWAASAVLALAAAMTNASRP